MSEFVQILPYSVDLNDHIGMTPLPTLFATEDDQAHRFELTVHRNGAPVDLTGVTVLGYFIRCSDKKTEKVKGSGGADGKATLTLNKYCYLMPGKFILTIKLEKDGVKSSIFHGEGGMRRSMTDNIEDDERIILGIDDILAHIDAMEEAEKAAHDAAAAANEAASRTPYIDEATNHWMTWDAAAGEYVDSGVEATGPIGPEGQIGPVGPEGPQGPRGTDGTSFVVRGMYETLDALTAAHATGSAGDAYAVGDDTSNQIYIWDVDAGAWVNMGALQGPAGKDGTDGKDGADGADGAAGADGYTPQRGTDYWTEEDQAQIVSDVLAALPNASGVSF